MASNVIDESTNQKYKDIAEGKEPKAMQQDILWITPRRLALLFGVMLVATLMFNGV